MDFTLKADIARQLESISSAKRLRRLRPLNWQDGGLLTADGRRLIDVSSNDYLGLSQHPLLKQRAALWAERYGAGAPASRLISGTRDITLAVEEKLAVFKQCEAALLFPSGFQANATVIPALARLSNDELLIFSDELNHASLVHGCRMTRHKPQIFRHNDLQHLADLLARQQGFVGRKMILTESVFSMDGDRADLDALVVLAQRHGAMLYVDEAHATGVFGPQGRGLAAATPGIDVVMGTLGKAMGSFGAYIAGSRALIDYLVNRCTGFIYTTALPPTVLGAVDAALDLVPTMDRERERLMLNAGRLRNVLQTKGYDTLNSTTQIIPAVVGSEEHALRAAQMLEAAGVLAVAIRPPTVPVGLSRLRLTLSASLSDADMCALLSVVGGLEAQR